GNNSNNSMAIDPNLGTMIDSSVDMRFYIDADANQTGRSFQWKTDGFGGVTGTELMRLTDTGLLGVGTTSPAALIDARTDQNSLTIINVRNAIATGNTSAGAVLQANSIDSSGFVGAFPSDYGSNTAFQKRLVISTNSTA